MAELGIPYEIISPDGSRAVIGNSRPAEADTDWCGMLDSESGGWTGLFDTAKVISAPRQVTGVDGLYLPPQYYGGRSGSVSGLVLPNAEMPAVNAAIEKLKAAFNAMRTDGQILWKPSGAREGRVMFFRLQEAGLFPGRRPKQFQFPLETGQPFILGALINQVTVAAGLVVPEIGIPDPIPDPIPDELETLGQVFVENEGNAPTWPRLRIEGEILNPKIILPVLGEGYVTISIQGFIGAGEYCDVYPQYGTVMLNGTIERPDMPVFAETTWFALQPGTNDIRLQGQSYSNEAALTVFWRNAYL